MEETLILEQDQESSSKKRGRLAVSDLKEGLRSWRIWLMLGWQDILLRYRRSLLGPFWITLSMAIMIYSMGLIYGLLFKMDLSHYFPHIASGMLVWTFLSTLIMDQVNSFVEASHIITQMKLPFSVYVLRVLARNFIIFFHNLLAICPLLIYFKTPVHFFYCLFGLIMIALCGFFYGTVLAMLGARFRDIKPIMQSFLQLVFYVTPIMWMPEMLPPRFLFIVRANPFQQIIQLFRAPLMGSFPSAYAFFASILITLTGFLLMVFLMIKSRHRIPFWV